MTTGPGLIRLAFIAFAGLPDLLMVRVRWVSGVGVLLLLPHATTTVPCLTHLVFAGLPHLLMVRVRWVSGVGVLLLCYPVLQQLGIVSHFLLSLPLVVGVFTALALMLSLKKPKVLSLLLMAGLTLLMCLWMSYLPWGLIYYFLGVLPLRAFYALVASNFVLCILVIFAAWHNSKEILGLLLLLQATGLTVCEVGLYQAGLYPLPTFQLTGIMAAYMLHRLYLADKLTRNTAAFASAVQLTKTAITALGYLLQEGMMIRDKRVVEISAADFLTLLAFVGVVVWIFVYETKEEVSLFESGKHVGLLMLCLGVSARSFLVPIGRLLLQDDPTLADLVGLWYGLSSVLVLLYALQHSGSASVMEQLMRVAIVLGAVGALVMAMQPQFVFTLYALYQWSEVLSILLLAAILATGVTVSFFQTLVTAAVLGVCPGVHAALLLYEQEATVLHLSLVAALTCTLLAFFIIIVKTQEVSDTAENFFKIGTVTAVVLLAAVMAVDLINLEARSSLWTYPCWRVALGVMAIVALALKMLAVKLGPQHLPLTKREDHGLPLIPVIGNMATVATFLLACTQGPEDGLLHDLWCSASALFLVFLQRDSLLLSSLSPSNRGTPTVVAAIMALVLSTIWRSRLWLFNGIFSTIVGFLEIVSVFASLPVYIVLAGIMWRGEIWSEKAVVFMLPMNALLVLLGTSFTSWALCVAGAVCGIGMMMFKLPLLPYNCQIMQR
ncbi:hypothetical protein V1264_015800 [Littorina saxatilis]|uniref:Uncharacterized protein n=1 Tax=Littorina saxatilis TaxID=31220 RepID=A0AAN9BMZ1_9CAEN